MRSSAAALLLAALLSACLAAAAAAHPVEEAEDTSSPVHLLHLGSGSSFAALPDPATATPPVGRGLEQAAPDGPCTAAARAGMPEGEGHDHQNVDQHRDLRCRIQQSAFLPLNDELKARPDVVLGEMDVKADIAAVSVIWPEGGILFFDVSKPAQPKFLSWYRSSNCESAAIANNCGAFVDLSADGKTAFIALQSLSAVPAPEPGSVGALPTTAPGVEVVDATDPRRPSRRQILPVVSQGGVHTARSHVVPDGPGPNRAPGEYVFSIANNQSGRTEGSGIDISKLDARGLLTPVSRIEIGETHDTFIQNDPVDGRTYLYIAGGYQNGLLVYDVTNPAQPRRIASWNLTPECRRDWYSHTVDVAHRNGRRIVTMPAELFVSTETSAADKERGCGNYNGNGDQAGPLWFIDATDFSKLGQAGESNEQLKAKSTETLIATWTNPAGRAAGNLTFSPHNQQIVGDKVYLSDYHGGVFVLDASGAFAGRRERPREMGYIVPSGERDNKSARPLAGAKTPLPTAVPRTRGRSSIWDMVYYKGQILAADQVGGFYSLHYEGDPVPPGGFAPSRSGDASGQGCRDRTPPRSSVARKRSRVTRRGVVLRGRTRDRGCGARVHRVRVSIAREVGRRCSFLVRGRFTRPRNCRRTPYVSARGRGAWRLTIRRAMPRGRYKVWVRGIDASGNIERKFTRENFLRLRVR